MHTSDVSLVQLSARSPLSLWLGHAKSPQATHYLEATHFEASLGDVPRGGALRVTVPRGNVPRGDVPRNGATHRGDMPRGEVSQGLPRFNVEVWCLVGAWIAVYRGIGAYFGL